MSQLRRVTLDSVCGGAAVELFDRELGRVLRNIEDPNTSPTEARKIMLEVTIAPNEDRDSGFVKVKCASKLAGVKPIKSPIFMGREKGQNVAYQNDPKQPELFEENVVEFKGEVNA